jgi:hypothetical protein
MLFPRHERFTYRHATIAISIEFGDTCSLSEAFRLD